MITLYSTHLFTHTLTHLNVKTGSWLRSYKKRARVVNLQKILKEKKKLIS